MKESEAHLKLYWAILQNVRDAIHVMDMQGDIIEVSNAFCEMLGYTREEASKLNIADWNAQYSRDELRQTLKNLVGKSARIETVHRRKDGKLVDVEINTIGVNIDGQHRFFASSRDITERKWQEKMLATSEKYQRAIFDAAPDAMLIANGQGVITMANAQVESLLGYTAKELVGQSIEVLVPERFRVAHPALRAQFAASPASRTMGSGRLVRVVKKDGSEIDVEVRLSPIKAAQGIFFASSLRDISESKFLERGLKLAQFSVDHARDAIFRIDRDARIRYVNIAACNHLQYSSKELLTMSVPDINSDFSMEVWHKHWDELTVTGWKRFETYHKRKDGTLVPVEVVANSVEIDGDFVFTSFVRDITERKRAEEEIHNLAFYDSLTGLPNRRLLLDRLNRAFSLSVRSRQYGALLFMDMDKFKTLNDTLGHDFGDLLLAEVARRIKSCVREVDTVARLAGDEFVVLLEEVGAQESAASRNVAGIAEKIRLSLAAPYQLKEHVYHSSSSIGVSLFYGNEKSDGELIKCADIAMYQAKNAGQNTVRFFDSLAQ